MKQPAQAGSGETVKNSSSTMATEAKESVEEKTEVNNTQLAHAATKIQATYRGHLTRKHEAEKKGEPESTSKEEGISKEEELDIDLTDPDLNKAAVKIQASFRGHMVRKENEDEQEQNAAVSK
ncbi:unnamed protein product [Acanthoscelides obtectus]|uniref:Neuromodulin n=1 Tax=Acanthoscelides obtectus TaxID=200917 RepID=A0A9P0K649_ACAOB|nr:unnamed protein product [Acanthoscelides obtectus]CAK1658247.1 hypothetical protein AOBTE_LOCUS20781 [Acanthoscelides obtectus]